MRSNLPSLVLLEATHTFPCAYMFKAIGRAEGGFAARVVAAVRDALGAQTDPPFRTRHSTDGRHVSVTLEPTVQTPDQVLAVYERLRTTAGLVMYF